MGILAEARELTAHRTVVGRLPGTLRARVSWPTRCPRPSPSSWSTTSPCCTTTPDHGLARHLVVAERKTGALFGAACELGALAARCPDTAWCRAFGRNLGTAYQIADDLADGWPGPRSARDRDRGEARRRIAAALHHLDTAAGAGSAAEDLRLLVSAVLTEPSSGRRIPGAHTPPETPSEEIES
ncbi:hypothetical protein ABH926_009456 [Catenulispora sp. GP43]|uniref:polyprenyl synthetase family protein n=1 Tax=Catenulispora sp. GP43 TaxID=3156263 RepID=UPI003513B444